ncbi:MAG: hypothetical protein GQ574_06400 [Crocinitomix sp.]|nr:hypothetical protein [Crocinitomix sp.]
MPPLTHQSLNTFGCYIDGELFVAGGGDSYWDSPPISGSFSEVDKYLGIQGTRYKEDFSDNIRIRDSDINATGDYEIEMFGDNKLLGYRNWHGEMCDYYFDSLTPNMGIVSVTYLNKIENIISGTFSLNLTNSDCESDTLLKVTDGRFDFFY